MIRLVQCILLQAYSPTQNTDMADNKTQIDPRYMKYNKDETEALLDKVNAQQLATEADVRAMVTDYETPEGE